MKEIIFLTCFFAFACCFSFSGKDSCIDNNEDCRFEIEQKSLTESCDSEECDDLKSKNVWFYEKRFSPRDVYIHANGHVTFGADDIDFNKEKNSINDFPYVNLPYFKVFKPEYLETIEYQYDWTFSDECKNDDSEVQRIIDKFFIGHETNCETYLKVTWKTCVRENSEIHDDFSSIVLSSKKYTLIINQYDNLSKINAEVLVVGVAGGKFTNSWFSFDINQTDFDEKSSLFLGTLEKSTNMLNEPGGYWAWSSEIDATSRTCPEDGVWKEENMHNRSNIKLSYTKCSQHDQYFGDNNVVRACAVDPNGDANWAEPNFDECDFDISLVPKISPDQASALLQAIGDKFKDMESLSDQEKEKLIEEVEMIMDKIDVSKEKFLLDLPDLQINVDLMSRYVTDGPVTRSTGNTVFKCGRKEECSLNLGSSSLLSKLNITAENRVKCAIYNDGTIFVPKSKNKYKQKTTGEAISFSIGDLKIENLSSEDRIELVFERNSTKSKNRRNWDSCNFWDTEEKKWIVNGCVKDVRLSDSSTTVCKCDHFTNFASLYTPFREENSIPEAEGLNITTYVVCGMSIICLLATIGIHLWFEKLRTSAQKRILISLCFAILGRDTSMLAIGFSGTGLASCQCKNAYLDATCELDLQDTSFCNNGTEFVTGIDACRTGENSNDIFGDSIVKIVEAYGNGEEEYMSLRKELKYCPQLVAAAAIAQYFITAVFFWMACEGVHLYYSVAVVLNKPRSKYITKLSVVGWGMPLLFTVIVLIVEATTGKGYTLNFEYAQSSILETNFWVFLDSTMYYVFILMPFVIIWLFNMIMFGMVMSALINSQSNVVKTFQRISNFLSMSQPDKRKSTQTRISPPKLSRNVSNNATKNHQKRLQGMIGLLTILGGAQILMLLLANPSSNNNTLAYIFIILNGLQGVFIFIFYVLLREEVLKLLGFAIKPKIAKTSVGQKRSGMTDSSFFDPATPVSDIPEEKFFQAISQKSSSNISAKPLGSPKLLRNRHVFWKSPTIRPETADGNRGKSEKDPKAGAISHQEKRTVKTTSSVPASFGSAKDPTIEDLRR